METTNNKKPKTFASSFFMGLSNIIFPGAAYIIMGKYIRVLIFIIIEIFGLVFSLTVGYVSIVILLVLFVDTFIQAKKYTLLPREIKNKNKKLNRVLVGLLLIFEIIYVMFAGVFIQKKVSIIKTEQLCKVFILMDKKTQDACLLKVKIESGNVTSADIDKVITIAKENKNLNPLDEHYLKTQRDLLKLQELVKSSKTEQKTEPKENSVDLKRQTKPTVEPTPVTNDTKTGFVLENIESDGRYVAYRNNKLGIYFPSPIAWGEPYIINETEKYYGPVVVKDYKVKMYLIGFRDNKNITLSLNTDNQGIFNYYIFGDNSRGPDNTSFSKTNPRFFNNKLNFCNEFKELTNVICYEHLKNVYVTYNMNLENIKRILFGEQIFGDKTFLIHGIYKELQGEYSGVFGRIKYSSTPTDSTDKRYLNSLISEFKVIK